MRLLKLNMFKKNQKQYYFEMKLPSHFWWGLLTLICMCGVILLQLSDMQTCLVCSDSTDLNILIQISSTLFLFGGFFKIGSHYYSEDPL